MSIEDLIDNITTQDFAKAGPLFSDIIGDKLNTALEQEKIRLADVTFNGAEDNEEQLELDLEPDDEELEDDADELELDDVEDDVEEEPIESEED